MRIKVSAWVLRPLSASGVAGVLGLLGLQVYHSHLSLPLLHMCIFPLCVSVSKFPSLLGHSDLALFPDKVPLTDSGA